MTRNLLEPLENRTHLSGQITVNATGLVFSDARGGGATASRVFSFTNTGDKSFVVNSIALTGTRAADYKITAGAITSGSPINIKAGRTYKIAVSFSAPSSAAAGIRAASVQINSTAANAPTAGITLRGIVTTGVEANNEPSLQRVLDAYQIADTVGDDDVASTRISYPLQTPNSELVAQTFVRASNAPITFQPLAAFVIAGDTAMAVGTYDLSSGVRTERWSVPGSSYQTVDVKTNGTLAVNVGTSPFGLYAYNATTNGLSYSQDSRNAVGVSNGRQLRVYPYKNATGAVVQNAYVIANETTSSYSDLQDLVYVIRNVKLASDTVAPGIPSAITVVDNIGDATLSWSPTGSEAVAGYNIRRSTTRTRGFSLLTTTALSTNTTYVDRTAGNKRYYYRISAVDFAGNESEVSKVTVKVLPPATTSDVVVSGIAQLAAGTIFGSTPVSERLLDSLAI